MKNLVTCLLLLCAALPSRAATPCPPTHKDLEWSLQCFDASATGRRVKDEYLRNVRVKKNGVAIIRIAETFEMLAVDRRGQVVIPDIAFAGDYDYPSAPGNVGRYGIITRSAEGKYISAKCGYFDTPARMRPYTPNTLSTESARPSRPRPKMPFCASAGSASSYTQKPTSASKRSLSSGERPVR
jgi:hypothetical protein